MERLTRRELEIAILIHKGYSNKAIARLTGTAEGTVKVHLHNIYEKLDISNRTELAVFTASVASRAALAA